MHRRTLAQQFKLRVGKASSLRRMARLLLFPASACIGLTLAQVGSEKAIPRHLQDGEEFSLPLPQLLNYGERLFRAVWTRQDGAGRPLTTGTGEPLADPSSPLVFPRNFNRVSGPEANSCFGCHTQPRAGGGGEIVAKVFFLGQRFDFATFDPADPIATRGSRDELGRLVTLQSIANERAPVGLFGSGFIEMLSREMTGELRAIRDAIAPGQTTPLITKGVSFGQLGRTVDGDWDVSQVEGLPASSLVTSGPGSPPSLILRPFSQAAGAVSLREFTNSAFNHHLGMQSSERFGSGLDPDGDGVRDELTRADITAATLFQATLPVPGRVIPRDREAEAAIRRGEQLFTDEGCAGCHIPALPLTANGRIYSEPNPYNPPGNLQTGQTPSYSVDLISEALPQPRLFPGHDGIIWVPAFTDLKLHDITSGPDDPGAEPLDMQHAAGSEEFFEGNRKFLTKKLWGAASQPPYFHHGKYTTLREAVLAHSGEALAARQAFDASPPGDRDSIIEFLKSLQVLPPGSRFSVVDEAGRPRPGYQF